MLFLIGGVDNELEIMLQRMSAKEQKWLIRIVLKDMKLRMGHSRVLGIFHPDAKELYDVSNSLVKVCVLYVLCNTVLLHMFNNF